MFGKLCPFCGTYIKFLERVRHERWHADQVVHITTLLCSGCFTEHGKEHVTCGTFPACRCVCNAATLGN